MPERNAAVLAFNRGLLSTLALARIDITRYKMAAEIMVNWTARVLGAMSLRVGTQYLTNTYGNALAKVLPLVFSTTDLARVETTAGGVTVLINDAPIVRPAVTAAVTNGNMTSDLSGWTDSDQSGAASTWLTGGGASLLGTGSNEAILDQQVATSSAGIEHALRIVVLRGPVMFRCGSTQGDDSYVNETALGTGTHSLAFTPAGAFWIRFFTSNLNASQLGSCNVEAAGTMVLPSPWAAADIPNLRHAQSADVTYVCCNGTVQYQPRKIQRRSTRSWSIVLYEPTAGPFKVINTTPITLTPSAISGDITVTASQALFKAGHVGSLLQLTSAGQAAQASILAQNVFTNPIRVNGVGAQRQFAYQVSGTFVGTVTIQSSVGAPGAWVDVSSYTSPSSGNINDGQDNSVIYYRIGIKAGNYTSGTASVFVGFSNGSQTANLRIRAYTDSTHVDASVLTIDAGTMVGQNELGATTATSLWSLGAFSDQAGWPQETILHEGRLWFFGSTLYGSVSDDFENFDALTLGASAPIQESIGDGPIDNICWALSMQRLAIGLPSADWSARSSSLDAPLSDTDFVVRPFSTIGSANVRALKLDKQAIYVQISGTRLMQATMDIYTYDYKAEDMTLLVPDLNAAGIVQLVIQRIPDTRIHCRRADGTVGVLVLDAGENVLCWQEYETPAASGFVEDMSILPGTPEDQVYYVVRRVINGATVRFHEKWALQQDCTGLPVAHLADAYTLYSGAPTTTITGLSYLEGQQVVAWGWNTVNPFTDSNGTVHGIDLGPFTVVGGQIAGLPQAVTNACVGLPYTAQWKSMKAAFAAAMGTPINQVKKIDQLGLMLQNTHVLGIHFGPDFDTLDDIPYADFPRIAATDNTSGLPEADITAVMPDYENQMTSFSGKWDSDQRVCLQAAAPRPATCLAFTIKMDTSG